MWFPAEELGKRLKPSHRKRVMECYTGPRTLADSLDSVQNRAAINTTVNLRAPLKVGELSRSDYQIFKESTPYIWLICITSNCEKYILKYKIQRVHHRNCNEV
jgi:hypothetical protein